MAVAAPTPTNLAKLRLEIEVIFRTIEPPGKVGLHYDARSRLPQTPGHRMVSQCEVTFSSPGVYAWEWKQPGFKSPINGALDYAAFSNPGVNAWARENTSLK